MSKTAENIIRVSKIKSKSGWQSDTIQHPMSCYAVIKVHIRSNQMIDTDKLEKHIIKAIQS